MKLTKNIGIVGFFLIGLTQPSIASEPTNSNLPNNFFTSLWGKSSSSQVLLLPGGIHFDSNNASRNNKQWLIALNLHGFIGGTFVNSRNRRVYFAGLERQVYKNGPFSVDYLIGIMRGYRGEGLDHLGPILKHDPGPLIALTGSWAFTEHFTINIATYGVGGLAGVSYLI